MNSWLVSLGGEPATISEGQYTGSGTPSGLGVIRDRQDAWVTVTDTQPAAGSNPVPSPRPLIFQPPEEVPFSVLAPSLEIATARVQQYGGSLTEAEVRAVLTEAGWPVELHDQALRVSFCESRWSPYASGDSGRSLGLFQLNAMWFGYAGEDGSQWADPLVNARTAYAVYRYDLSRGQRPWQQWSCKP